MAYHRRLKRTPSMGLKRTNQKLGDVAIAVMNAIFDSGTCAAAMSWGTTKRVIPVPKPRVALERPISHTGGRRRMEFKRASRECLSSYLGPRWDWRVFQQECPKTTLRKIPAVFGPGNAHAGKQCQRLYCCANVSLPFPSHFRTTSECPPSLPPECSGRRTKRWC